MSRYSPMAFATTVQAQLTSLSSPLRDWRNDDVKALEPRASLPARRERLLEQQAALAALTRSEVFSQQNPQQALQLATETAARLMDVERVSFWRDRESRSTLRCFDLYEKSLDRHSSG